MSSFDGPACHDHNASCHFCQNFILMGQGSAFMPILSLTNYSNHGGHAALASSTPSVDGNVGKKSIATKCRSDANI